jgi:tetratricopeptide (TPR) repeat protein
MSKTLCLKGINLSNNQNNTFYYKLNILYQSLITDGFFSDDFINKLKKEIIPFFLKNDPSIAVECFVLLGNILANKNKYKLASEYYEKAFELNYQYKRKELLY